MKILKYIKEIEIKFTTRLHGIKATLIFSCKKKLF